MNNTGHFNNIVEEAYNLSLDEKIELKNLLEHNIADASRKKIETSYKRAKAEEKAGKLKFSSDPDELIKML